MSGLVGDEWCTPVCAECGRVCLLGPVQMRYCPEHSPLVLPAWGEPMPKRAAVNWVSERTGEVLLVWEGNE